MDSVVCAEILLQFLFALGVVKLPEFMEKLSVLNCDMLQHLPSGIDKVTMNAQYRYSEMLYYFVPPPPPE